MQSFTLNVSRVGGRIARATLPVCILGLALATPALAQTGGKAEAPKPRVPAAVSAAHQFVLSAYPDLLTRAVSVTLTSLADGQIVVAVTDAAPTTGKAPAPAPLVSALVAFDAGGRVKTFAATGTLLEDARYGQLQQQLAAHPEWRDADKDAWLQAAGGPSTNRRNAPTVAALGNDAVRTFLGDAVLTEDAAFHWTGVRTSVKVEGPPLKKRVSATAIVLPEKLPAPPPLAIKPVWVVEVAANAGSSQQTRYQLEYEPFGGRLVSVVRR